ncbi:MAG: S9 family peptidase, partial [Halobacteria archaeon]|nr:S9 family peptidase [Halobacteria archaeon]
VDGENMWFSNYENQRLYRQSLGGEPEPITPEPQKERGDRYADADITPDGERLYCVRERHTEGDEPENTLVMVPSDGSEEPTVVASGHDFYSSPRVSPDGSRLAWLTWDHPSMPWDSTNLHVARIADDGTLVDEREVLGGTEESVFQPEWGPKGVLHAVSDRTGWWNLYRIEDGSPVALHTKEAEFGVPQWVFGLSTYAFLDDGRIAVIVGDKGEYELGLLNRSGDLHFPDLPFDAFPRTKIRSHANELLFIGANPRTPKSIVGWEPGEEHTILRRSGDVDVDDSYISVPEHITFPTGEEEAHAFYYPPHNPDVEEPDEELPPLIVMCHGGPTANTLPTLDMEIQFWTTRGFGVADVNYRGSTGYGREYRERLNGEWGIIDTLDCVNAARYLVDEGEVDGNRLAIRGGSAGGYATLCALAFHDTFDAGASYYGVADLEALAEKTHKFESRYLDSLVGPLPEAKDIYEDRSPVYHADGIDCPILLLQGEEDAVVPPSQAEMMIESLEENNVPYAYLEFEGEQHGFRRAESIERAIEAELSFYAQVFGFEPADDVEPVELIAEDT